MLAPYILAAFVTLPNGVSVELHGGFATVEQCRAAIAPLAATLPPGVDAGCITPAYIAAQRAYAVANPGFHFELLSAR